MCKRFRYLCISVLLLTIISTGCNSNQREYHADIRIPLQHNDGIIIVREWSWLTGSGAEIYWEVDGKITLLGECGRADDGYCPFRDGRYTFEEKENEIIFTWYFNTSADGEEIWHSEAFQLD